MSSAANAVAWSPDGTKIASASGKLFLGGAHTVQVWDAASGATRYIYQGHTLGVIAVAWSPDGQLLAEASNDGTVRVWQAT